MLEPRIFSGTVPVFYFCRDGDDGARSHFLRFLAPFLIPAATGDADQYLHLFVMDMPIVTAARFECDIMHTTAYISQVAVADEILRIARIGFALRPLTAQGIALAVKPRTEFVNEFLRVAHVYSPLLVGSQLWSNTIETAQGCYGYYLAICSRELVASEDVTKEV